MDLNGEQSRDDSISGTKISFTHAIGLGDPRDLQLANVRNPFGDFSNFSSGNSDSCHVISESMDGRCPADKRDSAEAIAAKSLGAFSTGVYCITAHFYEAACPTILSAEQIADLKETIKTENAAADEEIAEAEIVGEVSGTAEDFIDKFKDPEFARTIELASRAGTLALRDGKLIVSRLGADRYGAEGYSLTEVEANQAAIEAEARAILANMSPDEEHPAIDADKATRDLQETISIIDEYTGERMENASEYQAVAADAQEQITASENAQADHDNGGHDHGTPHYSEPSI